MKNLTPEINLDEEVAAVAAYLALKWAPRDDLLELVTAIKQAALRDARGWTIRHDVGFLAHDLYDDRVKLLVDGGKDSDARYYDAYLHLLKRISYLDDALYEVGIQLDGRWDYERRVKRLAWSLTEKHPGLPNFLPLGWEEAQSQDEDDLCEAYSSKADQELFHGSKVESMLSGSFPWRVALSTVYKGKSNGLDPWIELVGAVYAQFLGIASYLNTHGLLKALKAALPYDAPDVQFTLPEKFDNPFLQMLLKWAGPPQTEAAYQGAQLHRKSLSLPKDEGAALLKSRLDLIEAYAKGIAQMHSKSFNRSDEAQVAELAKELSDALEAAKPKLIVIVTDGDPTEGMTAEQREEYEANIRAQLKSMTPTSIEVLSLSR